MPGTTMTAAAMASVDAVVADFVEAAKAAFGADLRSVVLFGSAAEGRLRPTSDVNMIVVLAAFDPAKAAALRGPLAVAQAAARVAPMFVLESEIAAAADSFAVKFADVVHRHKVLHGPDPFAGLVVPRAARIGQLRQVLLNLLLRLRERWVERGRREEQLALLVADAAGPLRAASAALLELEGKPAASPRDALIAVARESGDRAIEQAVARVSEAREQAALPPGVAGPTLLALIDLAGRLRSRAEALGS